MRGFVKKQDYQIKRIKQAVKRRSKNIKSPSFPLSLQKLLLQQMKHSLGENIKDKIQEARIQLLNMDERASKKLVNNMTDKLLNFMKKRTNVKKAFHSNFSISLSAAASQCRQNQKHVNNQRKFIYFNQQKLEEQVRKHFHNPKTKKLQRFHSQQGTQNTQQQKFYNRINGNEGSLVQKLLKDTITASSKYYLLNLSGLQSANKSNTSRAQTTALKNRKIGEYKKKQSQRQNIQFGDFPIQSSLAVREGQTFINSCSNYPSNIIQGTLHKFAYTSSGIFDRQEKGNGIIKRNIQTSKNYRNIKQHKKFHGNFLQSVSNFDSLRKYT